MTAQVGRTYDRIVPVAPSFDKVLASGAVPHMNVLRLRIPWKPKLSVADRLLFVWLDRLFPSVLSAVTIVQPETIIRWHRAGFRLYWRWKSRSRGGRPKVPLEIRRLIREMSLANRLWGAPRIHGELLKLGIDIAQSTVAKYMARGGRGRSQTWKTFLHNHSTGIAAMDFLVVPTVGFKLLFVLVILRHQRRRLISLTVTTNPTAEWISRQITEAFPWNEAPKYLIRDRDASYGHAVTSRLAAMGIRDHPVVSRIFRTLVGGLLRLSDRCVALLEQLHIQISFGRPACASNVPEPGGREI